MAESLQLAVRQAVAGPGKVGPNAAIQLAEALTARLDGEATVALFEEAGLAAWAAEPPGEMIDEAAAARLFRLLFRRHDATTAAAIAADAGRRTADYVLANRIPRPARLLLPILPAVIAGPLLLRAIARHAWTFAGSGCVTIDTSHPWRIEIAENPLAMPGCVWHVAVFRGVVAQLVAPRAKVRHLHCCRDGASACRFEIVTEQAR